MPMQTVSALALRGRSVVTETGTRLGNLSDILFDPDQGRIVQLLVRPRILGGATLAIAAAAIVEIKPTAIIVKDAFVKETAPALA